MGQTVFDLALDAHGGLIDRIVATFERDRTGREDLRQEVALALWRAAPSWREDCSLRTFVARVAHNVCVSHVRRVTREPKHAELDVALPAESERPDEAALRADMGRRLARAVADLPPALRDVAVLMLEGFSPREIADTLGVAEGAVATRATRAKAALRAMMEPT
ncbi:MAG: sigma-70 family RNA polymerase sigma factor [Alphaproteobacteria bacterium]|nr:sigma-70 family RNA polymerase sigma factor [Alphaproteobacteria bacterium]